MCQQKYGVPGHPQILSLHVPGILFLCCHARAIRWTLQISFLCTIFLLRQLAFPLCSYVPLRYTDNRAEVYCTSSNVSQKYSPGRCHAEANIGEPRPDSSQQERVKEDSRNCQRSRDWPSHSDAH